MEITLDDFILDFGVFKLVNLAMCDFEICKV